MEETPRKRRKLIIDTDPGIDDAMAIFMAFNSPEVDVIGLTTIFGNVRVPDATKNALIILQQLDRTQVPVAEGVNTSLAGLAKVRVADFVHGSDGLGNTNQPTARVRPLPLKQAAATHEALHIETPAAAFIAQQVRAHPGEVTVLALGPLTNIAMALQTDKGLHEHIAELVVLGGAFNCNGNVNPAAEANIFGDPDAADFVFGCPMRMRVVGLDVTHQCFMRAQQIEDLPGRGALGQFLYQISQFYLAYHKESYQLDGMYLHDPAAFAAVIAPELFTWRSGAVRVVTDGLARGLTLMDEGKKVWNGPNAWMGRPAVSVAVGVDAAAVVQLVSSRLLVKPGSSCDSASPDLVQ